MTRKWFYIAWACFFAGLIALLGAAGVVAPETRALIFEEDGVVETMSAAGYFIGFVLLLILMGVRRSAAGWSLSVALLCLCFRELDFHKQFTTMSIFKSRFLTSSKVPTDERVVGILIIVALLALVFLILKTYLKPFVAQLRRRDPCALSILFAGMALVVSKSLDGVARKLEPFGIETTEGVKDFCQVLEESLETAAPFLLVLAISGRFAGLRKPHAKAVPR